MCSRSGSPERPCCAPSCSSPPVPPARSVFGRCQCHSRGSPRGARELSTCIETTSFTLHPVKNTTERKKNVERKNEKATHPTGPEACVRLWGMQATFRYSFYSTLAMTHTLTQTLTKYVSPLENNGGNRPRNVRIKIHFGPELCPRPQIHSKHKTTAAPCQAAPREP